VKMGMSAAKFGVNDRVRLIGADTIQTVMQYNTKTLEYQLKSGSDETVPVWIWASTLNSWKRAKSLQPGLLGPPGEMSNMDQT